MNVFSSFVTEIDSRYKEKPSSSRKPLGIEKVMILANNCNMRKLGIFACRLVSKHCQLKYLESTSTCQQNVMKICTVKMYALIQFKYKYKTQIQQTHVKWQVRFYSLPQSEPRDNLEVANILKLQSSSSSPFLLFPLILSTSSHATFLRAGSIFK